MTGAHQVREDKGQDDTEKGSTRSALGNAEWSCVAETKEKG